MKNVRDNEGFTLVEVLVSVVILGIIVGLAYPAVSNMQARNNNKKFSYYADSLVEAAKVYIKTYEKDFDITSNDENNKDNYCQALKYSDLLNKGLIKPYTDKSIDCSEETFVQVVKKNGQDYDYKSNLVCKNPSGIVYENKIENECNVSDFIPPTVEINLDLSSDKSSIIATVKITDASSGVILKENHNTISFAWSNDENEYADDLDYETYVIPDTDLVNGVVSFTKSINIEPSEDIKYFIINATGIEDGAGNNIKSGNSISKYSITYDTLSPQISSVSISSNNEHYNASDVNVATTLLKDEDVLYYDTSLNNDLTSENAAWKSAAKISGNSKNWNLGSINLNDDYTTGATKRVYAIFKDKNGNVSNAVSNDYRVYKYCDETDDWHATVWTTKCPDCDSGDKSEYKSGYREKYDLHMNSHQCVKEDVGPTACTGLPSCDSISISSYYTGSTSTKCGGNQDHSIVFNFSIKGHGIGSGKVCYSDRGVSFTSSCAGYSSGCGNTSKGKVSFSSSQWIYYRSNACGCAEATQSVSNKSVSKCQCTY